jgi:hypothetical protein
MSDLYRRGDYYLICAQSGRKIRRSEAVKQWDGVWVHRDFCDAPNPLDWPRKATPQRPVYPVRPEPTDVFITGYGETPTVVAFTITAEAGSYLITGTDVTLTNTTVTNLKLDFSTAANSQYVPLVFCNWM